MDKTDKEEPWISRNLGKLLGVIVAFAAIAAIAAATVYFAHLGGLPISDSDPAGWGQLGDYFGGLLNPVFSFLTILALVLTLILQNRELKLSREALELSQIEFKKSNEALHGQNKAIDRQSFSPANSRQHSPCRVTRHIATSHRNTAMCTPSSRNKTGLPILLAFLAMLAGCDESSRMAAPESPAMRMAAPAPAPMMDQARQASEPAQATPKYLAERQFWVFELPEKDIEARWQAHMNLCRSDCEVLNAALNKSTHAPMNAHLQIRVGRASADKLLAAMAGPEISERRVEREDKTLQVVDTEARLKNLTELRDRLRALLATRNGALKDVLETERELARAQGDLDSMTAQRLTLANETEKILLFADYRPEPSLGETGAMQPLVEAWRNAGHAFAESLSAALLFIVQALPWVVLVLPAIWGAWRLLRRLFDWRRKTSKGAGTA